MEPATNGICTYLHTLSRLVALPVARVQPDRALHVDRDADGVTLTRAGGETIHGALLVAAEGRNSPTREVEGIRTTRWNYRHVAMVTAIDHEVPHANTAYEIFYPGGPFALLPMLPDRKSTRLNSSH